jgi:dipeptidyl aminopeptidase/acylaminoacyl peptidase
MNRQLITLLGCCAALALAAGYGERIVTAQAPAPAAFAGAWVTDPLSVLMTFNVDGSSVSGVVNGQSFSSGTINGDTIKFTVVHPQGRTIAFEGTMAADSAGIVFKRTVNVPTGMDPGGAGIFGSTGPATVKAARNPNGGAAAPGRGNNRGNNNSPQANQPSQPSTPSPQDLEQLFTALRGRGRGNPTFNATGRGLANAPETRLMAVDRQGNVVSAVTDPIPASTISISPDGLRVAYQQYDGSTMALDLAAKYAVQIVGVAPDNNILNNSGTVLADTLRQLLAGQNLPGVSQPGQAVWSPDGGRIAYVRNQQGIGSLYVRSSDGQGGIELLLDSVRDAFQWSQDGRFIIAAMEERYVAVPMTGDRKPIMICSSTGKTDLRLSPDGRHVAFLSNEGGTLEVWVRTFDPTISTDAVSFTQWKISKNGARGMVRWRNDGKELYFIAADGMVTAVPIATTPAFKAGAPVPLFRAPGNSSPSAASIAPILADVSADGQRFAFLAPSAP